MEKLNLSLFGNFEYLRRNAKVEIYTSKRKTCDRLCSFVKAKILIEEKEEDKFSIIQYFFTTLYIPTKAAKENAVAPKIIASLVSLTPIKETKKM